MEGKHGQVDQAKRIQEEAIRWCSPANWAKGIQSFNPTDKNFAAAVPTSVP